MLELAVESPAAQIPGAGMPKRSTAKARKGAAEPGTAVRLAVALGLVANPRAEGPRTCSCPRAWRSSERCWGGLQRLPLVPSGGWQAQPSAD
eukprot:13072012-Heterocapsa_arctica.AAC.1